MSDRNDVRVTLTGRKDSAACSVSVRPRHPRIRRFAARMTAGRLRQACAPEGEPYKNNTKA